ncbi:MAG: hypothetical protein K2G64_05560, partial [Muribaculaceae bacterium]|nr:hypothetical protein [Muribaculaceae bacterium]
ILGCQHASSQTTSEGAATGSKYLPLERVTTDYMKKLVDPYASNINLTGKPLVVLTSTKACRVGLFASDYLQRYFLKHNPNATFVEYRVDDDWNTVWYKDFCKRAQFEGDSVPYIIFINPEGRTKFVRGFRKDQPEDVDRLLNEFLK